MNRRLRRVDISGDVLAEMLRVGVVYETEWYRKTIIEGLPKDAVVRMQAYNPETGTFYCTASSDEFAEVEDGALLPRQTITIQSEKR